MADRTPTHQAIEFGQHLTRLWTLAGEPKWAAMSRTILLETDGAVSISDQQLANLHAGKSDPTRVRVAVLVALCRYYGCEAAALGPVAAAEVAAIMSLTSSTQQFTPRGCNPDREPERARRGRSVPVAA